MQEGPILVKANVDKKDWINEFKPCIIDRINLYSGSEIKFNLMYVCDDKIEKYGQNIKEIDAKINYLNSLLYQSEYQGVEFKELKELSKDKQEEVFKNLYDKKDFFENMIKDEERKRELCREENVRRQHNYIPLIFEMLKEMSEAGTLEENYKKALEEEEENFKKQQEKEKSK